MSKIHIELDKHDLKDLIRNELSERLGTLPLLEDTDITIEAKSKQNYKSEWESASFRAIVDKTF